MEIPRPIQGSSRAFELRARPRNDIHARINHDCRHDLRETTPPARREEIDKGSDPTWRGRLGAKTVSARHAVRGGARKDELQVVGIASSSGVSGPRDLRRSAAAGGGRRGGGRGGRGGGPGGPDGGC